MSLAYFFLIFYILKEATASFIVMSDVRASVVLCNLSHCVCHNMHVLLRMKFAIVSNVVFEVGNFPDFG